MSKSSAKQKYTQLKEWLQTINQPKTAKAQTTTNFSKADYYKQKGA